MTVRARKRYPKERHIIAFTEVFESLILEAIEQEQQQSNPPNGNVANNVDIDVDMLTLSSTTLFDRTTVASLNSGRGRRRNTI